MFAAFLGVNGMYSAKLTPWLFADIFACAERLVGCASVYPLIHKDDVYLSRPSIQINSSLEGIYLFLNDQVNF